MATKKIEYNGNHLFKHNFGLYEIEGIDFEASKDNILEEFKAQYGEQLKDVLESLGLKLIDLEYYSPREYNFDNDSIDPTIRVVDKLKLKKAILENEKAINEALTQNVSYDGYMALTVNSVSNELEKLDKPNYEPDILVLSTLLKVRGFDINKEYGEYPFIHDHLIWEDEDENI